MTPLLISCIVPAHDGERYLGETLDSIAAQTHAPIEIIVIDDGSTDGTRAVAEAHPRRPAVYSYERGGHAAARNRGVARATGAFIAFLDADDLWVPDKLALQLAHFTRRPELGVVFAHLENFVSPDVAPGAAPEVGTSVPGYTSVTMLARRDVFERVGPFDEGLAHGNDRDWFCRAAEAGVAIDMLPDVLVRRRLHGANRSTRLADRSREEYLRIIKRSLDRRRSQGGDTVLEYPFSAPRRE